MRRITIGIGGGGSGAGKTLLAERLLGRLQGWGGVKCSPSGVYCRVVTGPEADDKGKDTGRMLKAGAVRAALVEAGRDEMGECLDMAMTGMAGLPGVIVEGNGAIRILKPDITVFIADGEIKDSSEDVLEAADAVVSGIGGLKIKSGAMFFTTGEIDNALDYIIGLAEKMLKA